MRKKTVFAILAAVIVVAWAGTRCYALHLRGQSAMAAEQEKQR